MAQGRVVNIGSQLQLFLDDWLIESMKGLELKLHSPLLAEVVVRKDKPLEYVDERRLECSGKEGCLRHDGDLLNALALEQRHC